MKALVLGGAECVWDDMRRLQNLHRRSWDGIVVAVNDIGCELETLAERHGTPVPGLHHWASLHPELFVRANGDPRKGFLARREAAGLPKTFTTWTQWKDPRRRYKADRQIKYQQQLNGSSGLLGALVALEVGATKVVLCGIPMDRQPHFAESELHPTGKPWTNHAAHWRAWNTDTMKARLAGKVRSMSGNTMKLLDEPTRNWLTEP